MISWMLTCPTERKDKNERLGCKPTGKYCYLLGYCCCNIVNNYMERIVVKNTNGQMEILDFDFITEPIDPIDIFKSLVPHEDRPNGTLSKIAKMTPRKFAQSVLDVFEELGGMMWLYAQAQADPRGFIELLKKILPRQIEMDNLEGITVILTDQYGNTIEIEGGGQPVNAAGGSLSSGPGQLRTATSGNPPELDVAIKETFD